MYSCEQIFATSESIKVRQNSRFYFKKCAVIVIYACKKFIFSRLLPFIWSYGCLCWASKLLRTIPCYATLPWDNPHFENVFQNKNNFLYIKDIQKFPAAFFVYLDLKFMIWNFLSHHGVYGARSVSNHDFHWYISESFPLCIPSWFR